MKNVLFSNTHELNIILWYHGLNRRQEFIHSVGVFKKPIHSKTQSNIGGNLVCYPRKHSVTFASSIVKIV